MITRDPATAKVNVGVYRMQVYDRNTTGMHWQKHKDGAGQARGYEREGRRMEVAVAIGADPATVFSGVAPLPPGISEFLFAGFVRSEGVPLVEGKTVSVPVPAEAEIVLEGYVDPGERRREGPFGDHTGFYSLDDDFPVFHVTAVTRRRNPVYLTTIVGKPPMEDGFLGEAVERLFFPLVKKMIPELVDMHLPVEGIFHNLMLVSIDKRYPGHARKTMHAIWGTGQMMFTKTIVVFDRDADLRNAPEALWRALTAIDPERDIEFVHGPVDELDFASRLPCYGSKMGIDATRKWKEEGFLRRWPDEIAMSEDVVRRIDAMWPELGIRLRRGPGSSRGGSVAGLLESVVRLNVKVLVVDPAPDSRDALRQAISAEGEQFRGLASLADARKHLAEYAPDVVVAALDLPDGDASAFLAEISRDTPRRATWAIAPSGDLEQAVRAMGRGADDFLWRPISAQRVAILLENLRDRREGEAKAEETRLRLALVEAARRAARSIRAMGPRACPRSSGSPGSVRCSSPARREPRRKPPRAFSIVSRPAAPSRSCA